MSVYDANPTSATAVVAASTVRAKAYLRGATRNAYTSTPIVTMKWAVP